MQIQNNNKSKLQDKEKYMTERLITACISKINIIVNLQISQFIMYIRACG